MKQTAVEWLINELRKLSHNKNYHLGMGDIRITQGMLDDLSEQAIEMEKEQIMDAFNSGENSDDYFLPSLKLTESEVYYNETYKSK